MMKIEASPSKRSMRPHLNQQLGKITGMPVIPRYRKQATQRLSLVGGGSSPVQGKKVCETPPQQEKDGHVVHIYHSSNRQEV
jgi:hypothetical protein